MFTRRQAEDAEFEPDDKRLPDGDNWWWELCYITDALVTKTPILFIPIPQNASASIKTLWKLPQTDKDVDKMHLRVNFTEVLHLDYPKLVVLRNPLHRAVSGFFHLSTLWPSTNHIETAQTEWYRALSRKDITKHGIKKTFSLFLDYLEYRF